jgi:hypothetical protein
MSNFTKLFAAITFLCVMMVSIFTGNASAEVGSYVVSDKDGNLYEYNKTEVEDSYVNFFFQDGSTVLYEDIMARINNGGAFHAFYDNTGKYISYEVIVNELLDNLETFDLHTFTEDANTPALTDLPNVINKMTTNENATSLVTKSLLVSLDAGSSITGDVLIDKMNRTYGPENGTATITGNLSMETEEAGKITLNNVEVSGSEGGVLTVNTPNATVVLNNAKAKNLNVIDVAQNTIVINGDNTDIAEMKLNLAKKGIKIESDGNGGIKSITIEKVAMDDNGNPSEIVFKGNINANVKVEANVKIQVSEGSEIKGLDVASNVDNASIEVQESSKIGDLELKGSNVKVDLAKDSTVDSINVDEGSTNSTIDVKGTVESLDLGGETTLTLDKESTVSKLAITNENVTLTETADSVTAADINNVVKTIEVTEEVKQNLSETLQTGVAKIKTPPTLVTFNGQEVTGTTINTSFSNMLSSSFTVSDDTASVAIVSEGVTLASGIDSTATKSFKTIQVSVINQFTSRQKFLVGTEVQNGVNNVIDTLKLDTENDHSADIAKLESFKAKAKNTSLSFSAVMGEIGKLRSLSDDTKKLLSNHINLSSIYSTLSEGNSALVSKFVKPYLNDVFQMTTSKFYDNVAAVDSSSTGIEVKIKVSNSEGGVNVYTIKVTK